MEVMLEIYRTLKTLNMEWKPKKVIEESGAPEDEDPKKKRRREEEERVKKAQELYFVETRCRMDDVMVSTSLRSAWRTRGWTRRGRIRVCPRTVDWITRSNTH